MKKRDYEEIVPDTMMPHVEKMHAEGFEALPKDEFGRWVASHVTEVKGTICGMDEYKDASFCPKTRARAQARKKAS